MKLRSFMYIILSGILWGTSCLFVDALAPYGLTSLQMACVRGSVSAIAMCIFVFLYDRSVFKVNFKELLLYFGSGATMYLTAAFYYAAIIKSSPSTAVILMYTAPVMVMVYSVMFMGERFSASKGVSVVLMVSGCALVSGIAGGIRVSFIGAFLGLMSGVCYSAYNVFTKMQMNKKLNPLTATMYCYVFMALCSLIPCRPWEIIVTAAKSTSAIIPIIGCGLCTCVLPYFLYTLALNVLPAGTAASMGVMEPLSATILSVMFLGETLSFYSVVGIVLIMVAVFLLSRTKE